MRVTYVGEPVIDQFAVWNEDGTSKIPGITSFTRISWLNGVSQIMSVTVTEIGTTPGEYMMTFNPPEEGFWKVEVSVPSTGDVFASYYEVKKRTYRARMTAVDDRTHVRFALWLEEEIGSRVTDFESATATIISSDGTEIADMGSTTPTAAGLFVFEADSADVTAGAEYVVIMTAVKNSVSWVYNLGLSKVA